MASRTVIAELGGATLYGDTDPHGNRNELQFDAKKSAPSDPIGLRFGSWGPGTIVKLSADILGGDDNDLNNAPRRSERILIELRTDDHPDATANAGCVEVYLQSDPVGQETDRGEALVARLTRRAGLELFVPLNAYAGVPRWAGGVGSRVSRFYSDDGYYCFNVQGPGSGQPDGAIIQYKIVDDNGALIVDETQWTLVTGFKFPR